MGNSVGVYTLSSLKILNALYKVHILVHIVLGDYLLTLMTFNQFR